jgi:hypothetical protein
MTYPELCPICSCPIQLLCSKEDGRTPIGDIQDALDAHCAVVHPGESDVTA